MCLRKVFDLLDKNESEDAGETNNPRPGIEDASRAELF